MIQLPCLSTESPDPGLKKRLLFLTPLQTWAGWLVVNIIRPQSAPPEENPFVDETVRVVLNVKYFVPVSLVAKTLIKQNISSDQSKGFIIITLHRNCLLFRLFLAESTKREAITLSWSELAEFVGETNFL